MSIYKRKGSPYYWIRFSIKGIKVEESTKSVSMIKAKEYEIKRKHEVISESVFGELPKKTWQDAKERWLFEMKHKRSIVHDKEKFRWLDEHLNTMLLTKIDSDYIERLVQIKQTKPLQASTINRLLALIKSVLNRSFKVWGWLHKVPYIRLKKEPSGRIRWLSKEEAMVLMNHAPIHLRNMIEFTLETGLRSGNLLNLTWKEIDFDNGLLKIPGNKFKTGRNFVVPLSVRAIQILKGLSKLQDKIFLYQGKAIKQCNTAAFKKALDRSGIQDFTWHDLRHTWASWHVQKGTSLTALKALGGWESFSMVLRYGHINSQELKHAVMI